MFINLIIIDKINYRYNKVNFVDKIFRILLFYLVFGVVFIIGFFLNEF